MEEATREIIRGVGSHYELEGQTVPERVAKAVKAVNAVSGKRWKTGKGSTDPYHAQLWIFGDAVGEACWLKGHAAGLRRKAPGEGKMRVDLTLNELLQLSWLAHLGFQHMMPNYRSFEIHRFSGEQDAQEGAIAVGKIEGAIPAKARLLNRREGFAALRKRHFVDGWHDGWRTLQFGDRINLQFGELINQGKQARRDLQSFPSEDVTKPLTDFIANRATMGVIDR
jgi:hypothetical protein